MNQIKSLYTIAKRGHKAASLFALILAFAAFANADAMSSGHSHKGKKGSLKITAQTEVGGITLQPGDYEVKEVNSASGTVVEFVRQFDDFTVQDSGLPVHNQEVVGLVQVTEQALSAPPKQTQLQLEPKTADAIGLVIRGDDVEYSFAPSPMNAQTETVCANRGPQR